MFCGAFATTDEQLLDQCVILDTQGLPSGFRSSFEWGRKVSFSFGLYAIAYRKRQRERFVEGPFELFLHRHYTDTGRPGH
jgi:hypothetical protein